MAKALIHTPGKHIGILNSVGTRISPAKNQYLIRLRYHHIDDKLADATIVQHIMWAPPEGTQIPEIGAYILSRIFMKLPATAPERSAPFWLRKDINSAVAHLQQFVNRSFELTVETRQNPFNAEEFQPNLKYSFCLPKKVG